MIRLLSATALLALLAACGDGQPFEFEDSTETGGDAGGTDTDGDGEDAAEGDGFGSSERLLPGTANPSPSRSITRFEPENEDNGGFVRRVALRGGQLEVDNLAFDGVGPYQPGRRGPDELNTFGVFESATAVATSGSDIPQLDYRAIYGESVNTVRIDGELLPRTRFAIVRSGDFDGYGFGGFLYERNGGVEIPATGQAAFRGAYAGMRVFDGDVRLDTRTDLEFTTGDIVVLIDFADFNASDGVRGSLFNREVFTAAGGGDVEFTTGGTRLTDLSGNAILDLPPVEFVLSNAASTPNGEISGELRSVVFVDGEAEIYETGTYNGVLSGDLVRGGEIAGVLVLESEDPRFDSVMVQETGGFRAERD